MSGPRRPTRLPAWQEWAVYVTLGALVVTGLAWLALDSAVRVEGEFGSEHHPLQATSLMLHGLFAYAFLVIGGAMIPVHVKLGWAMGRNRKTGLWLAGTALFLALTALGLYYLGDEALRSITSLAHWLAGLVVIPALVIHAVRGRRS